MNRLEAIRNLNTLIEVEEGKNERRKVKRNKLTYEEWKAGTSQRKIAEAVGKDLKEVFVWIHAHERMFVGPAQHPSESVIEAEAAVRNRPAGPARTEQIREELSRTALTPSGDSTIPRSAIPVEREPVIPPNTSDYEWALSIASSINNTASTSRRLVRLMEERAVTEEYKSIIIDAIATATQSLEVIHSYVVGASNIDNELKKLLEGQS